MLYGLKSIWKDDGRLSHPFQMVPPFIEDVTPPERLPVPASLRTRPLLLLVAYERPILEKGVHVLSGLTQAPLGAILVSPDPAEGGRLMEGAGFSCGRFVSLPLSGDPDVFGLMALCSVSLVSNGFLQVMESIALESPVIALPRGTGVGMGPLNFDSRFDPYLSYDEEPERQRERILEWLRHPPFDEEMRRSLREERHGAGLCADRIESLAAQWNSRPALLMRARKAGAYFAGTLFRE